MYGIKAATPSVSQKKVLGFDKGYITIFKGNTYDVRDQLRLLGARYHKDFGWYIISTIDLPTQFPEGVEPVKLYWDAVGQDNGLLKPESEVQKAVRALTVAPSKSQYVGEKNEPIQITAHLVRVIDVDGAYQSSYLHIFEDKNENVYVWNTGSRKLEPNKDYIIKGKIKGHSEYQGTKQTLIYYCRVSEIND